MLNYTAELGDFLQDQLSGLKTREQDYGVPSPEGRFCNNGYYPWDDHVPEKVWIVGVWEDGLEYDDEGNAFRDDWPCEFTSSYHRSQRGAEIEAAWLEYHGISADRLRVFEGWTEPLYHDYVIRD